jgi:hypothetical protein
MCYNHLDLDHLGYMAASYMIYHPEIITLKAKWPIVLCGYNVSIGDRQTDRQMDK